jgi:hypothetical protein
VELLTEIAGRSKLLLWQLRRAFLNREHLSVVGVRRTEGRVSANASQSLGVAQRPHKVKKLLAASEPSGAEAAKIFLTRLLNAANIRPWGFVWIDSFLYGLIWICLL